MEFEHFALTRDFFYLAALLFGVGLGCILNRFRRKVTDRYRNVTVTVGLCFFSGSLVSLTLAIIFSNWMILKESSLYIPMGILAILPALAFRFPRALGFPLILVTGVFTVWMGYACLRFPVIDGSSQGRVTRDGSGLVHVRIASQGIDTVLSYHPETEVLEFRAFCFYLPRIFPLVGELKRGLIAEITTNEGRYVDPRLGKYLFPGQYPWPGADVRVQEAWQQFFSFQETLEKLETKTLLPGAALTILYDGLALKFR